MSHPSALSAAPALLMVSFDARRCGPARLPEGLAAAGFRVSALCTPEDPLAATRHLHRHFPLADTRSARHVAARLARALAATRPVLVIPCDERAVACLQALVRRGPGGDLDAGMIATLVASLGDPALFADLLMKDATLARARSLGIAVPEGAVVRDAAEARAVAARLGGTVYVKASFGWAGDGVRACRTPEDIDAAMAAFRPRRSSLRALARRLLGRNWYPADSAVMVQQAVDGAPAMVAAVAWQGRLLAAFGGHPLATLSTTGPSCAVGIGPDPEMEAMAERFIAATGASGFLGFDFLIERTSGRPLLLECNPRPIQTGHLGARIGVDLAAALAAGLRGETGPARHAWGRAEIALFPNGRAAAAGGLAFDEPADDAPLMAALLGETPRPSRLHRLLRHLHPSLDAVPHAA